MNTYHLTQPKETHFTRQEFACKCGCGKDTVDYELMDVLEKVREHFGVPVHISSGNRCKKYNKKVGGKSKSQHLLGKAADIVVDNVSPNVVHSFLDQLEVGGLGKYNTFTHVDVRDGRARWDG
jgi:uncharacterized protein YcbK (DUF882 family)